MIKKYLLLIAFAFLFSAISFSQKNWYVSPTGDDGNTGTISSPLKKVQTAINKMTAGDVVILRNGIYRESVNSSKNNINILAYPGETPILKGSVLMTDWTKQGDYWKKNVAIQPQQVFVDGNNPLQQIGWPWPDEVPLGGATKRYHNQVGEDLNDMAPGRFFWTGGVLYIWLKDSSDPNNHEIEVSQLKEVLVLRQSKDSYIKGIQIEHSNVNTYREQGSAVYLGNGCVLDECVIQWCDFGGVSMGDNSKVINSKAIHNGDVGIQSSGDNNFLVKNTELAYNNNRNFFSQWHAGGFKGATNTWGTIENCEIHNNNGSGVWFDYCHKSAVEDDVDGDNFYPIIVRNNYFHNNGTGNYERKDIYNNASILIEVSEQAYIYNNIIDTFEYRGIWVSSAWFSYFTNNILSNGKTKSYYAIDGGASYVSWAWVKNNVIANNILYNNNVQYDIRMMPDDGGTKYFDNICRNNLIYTSGRSVRMRYGGRTKRSIEDWQNSTPFGENSKNTDPLFANGQFHLADNSPCINTGADVLNDIITEDYIGNSRKLGPVIDMGVFEEAIGGTDQYNAVLQKLEVDLGVLEPVFSETNFTYTDTLPDDTKQTPAVTATPYNSGSVVTITDATNVQATDEADRTTTVTVTSESGVVEYTYKIIFYSKNTTSLNHLESFRFKLFPNPSNGILYVEGVCVEDVDIEIVNIAGKVIKVMHLKSLSGKERIDLSDQPHGIYLMKIKSNRNAHVVKFIIQ
jgi:hypothetical protein